jgi:hypothetical protein
MSRSLSTPKFSIPHKLTPTPDKIMRQCHPDCEEPVNLMIDTILNGNCLINNVSVFNTLGFTVEFISTNPRDEFYVYHKDCCFRAAVTERRHGVNVVRLDRVGPAHKPHPISL